MTARKALLLSAISLLLAADARAAGGTAFTSREIDIWPSSAALGHIAAVSRDPLSALWVNPAALTFGNAQVGATHTEWFQDTRAEQLAIALGGGRFRLGASAFLLSTSDIPFRPASGGVPTPTAEPLDYFEVRDFTLGLSAGYAVTPAVALGVTLRSLTQKVYTYDASSWALDFGAFWQVRPDIDLGLAVNSLGPALDWGVGDQVPMPRSLRLGTAYRLAPTVRIEAETWLVRDRAARLAGAVEWHPVPVLALRSGYLFGSDSENFSAGIGLLWRGIGFDYALVPLGNDLGTTHRAALRVIPSQLHP